MRYYGLIKTKFSTSNQVNNTKSASDLFFLVTRMSAIKIAIKKPDNRSILYISIFFQSI